LSNPRFRAAHRSQGKEEKERERQRFDELARRFATGASRRQLLKAMIGGTAALLGGKNPRKTTAPPEES
jgi:hypothetical protein